MPGKLAGGLMRPHATDAGQPHMPAVGADQTDRTGGETGTTAWTVSP